MQSTPFDSSTPPLVQAMPSALAAKAIEGFRSVVPPHGDVAAAPGSCPPLVHDERPLGDASLSSVINALLRSPARLLASLREGDKIARALVLLSVLWMGATALAMSSWSGGLQLAIVPLKLVALMLLCAAVCLPSLHVLSALSGSAQPIRHTWGALTMGIALMALLAVALSPIAWVLSAATNSVVLVGSLYLAVFVIASIFGLGLVRRALASFAGGKVRGLAAWSVMFVIVALQLATSLRPLVGPFDGVVLHERTFFVAHIADCLGGR